MKNIDRFDLEKIAQLYEEKDFNGALLAVNKLVAKLGHTSGWLDWMKGVCLDVEGRHIEALILFKSALETDPYCFTYHRSLSISLGHIGYQLDSMVEDETDLDKVRKTHRFLIDAGEFTSLHQYHLIKCYLNRGALKDAEELLENALDRNPNDGELKQLYAEMIENDPCSRKVS